MSELQVAAEIPIALRVVFCLPGRKQYEMVSRLSNTGQASLQRAWLPGTPLRGREVNAKSTHTLLAFWDYPTLFVAIGKLCSKAGAGCAPKNGGGWALCQGQLHGDMAMRRPAPAGSQQGLRTAVARTARAGGLQGTLLRVGAGKLGPKGREGIRQVRRRGQHERLQHGTWRSLEGRPHASSWG